MLKGNISHPHKTTTAVFVVLLWLVTAAVGLWEIFIIRDMVFRIYARFLPAGTSNLGPEYWSGVAMGGWLLVILSILWIAIIIGGGEYHFKRIGQPRSWKVFGWTIGIELFILVLALFI
jgi:hypothetical protein